VHVIIITYFLFYFKTVTHTR